MYDQNYVKKYLTIFSGLIKIKSSKIKETKTMRTKIIRKEVYQFDELSDAAKERALQGFAQFIGEEGWYAETVIEDAKNIGV